MQLLNKLIENINKENKIKKELNEKENNYNSCINEITKLEDEVENLIIDIIYMIHGTRENFNIFSILAMTSGLIYAVYDVLIRDSFYITTLIPITIGIGIGITTNIIGNKVIKKKLNSIEYKNIKQKREQKKIELTDKKEQKELLAEEIANLKLQLEETTNIKNEIVEELNSLLKDNNKLKPSTKESETEEKNHPKTRTLKPNKK